MSSILSLHGIRKVFFDSHNNREVVAVESFDLEVANGEMVTLLGPSGCGKTTVLRMLAGFETPTAGEIRINGQDVTTQAPNKRNSAMVFQSYALFPHMSVLENIAYGLKFRKLDKKEKSDRIERILDVVSLRGYEKRRPNELSGGQQQRVALARALVIEPALLLFDEPLSNLDAKLREFMRNEIRRVQQKLGITAVYVTHDQSEAMAISDRVVVMNKAKIEQIGTAYEVYHRAGSRFVADFMGAANFLTAEVLVKNEKSVKVDVSGYKVEVPFVPTHCEVGSKSLLVIRPESVMVKSESSPEGLVGTVVSYHFLGFANEYVVALPTGETLTARSESISEEGILPIGSRVKLSFRTQNLHLL